MGNYAVWLRYLSEKPWMRPFFGFHCAFCGKSVRSKRDLCDGCASLFVPRVMTHQNGIVSALCLNCGVEFQLPNNHAEAHLQLSSNQIAQGSEYCQDCKIKPHLFKRIVAPYRYEFPLSHIIRDLKYANRRVYARVLGSLLAEAVPEPQLQKKYVLGVPMDNDKKRRRGYNQAHDLARWCSNDLNLSCLNHSVERNAETTSLTGLSRQARELEIVGAFRAAENVYSRHLVIIDDVLTTGATTRELARELYDAGAASVELWVVARTSRDR